MLYGGNSYGSAPYGGGIVTTLAEAAIVIVRKTIVVLKTFAHNVILLSKK